MAVLTLIIGLNEIHFFMLLLGGWRGAAGKQCAPYQPEVDLKWKRRYHEATPN